MIITTIGSGNVGGTLARLWIDAGYEVRAAGRQNCAQVVAVADLVALCVPWSAAEVALKSCGDLAGKILIDCTNPLASGLDGLVLGGTTFRSGTDSKLAPECTHRQGIQLHRSRDAWQGQD